MKREKRYVQCISARIDFMIGILMRQVGCFVFDSVKTSSSTANMETWKLYWKYMCVFVIEGEIWYPRWITTFMTC